MASRIVFMVFVLPAIFSVTLAGAVMADILEKPGRELDMWPGAASGGHGGASAEHDTLKLVGLAESYRAGEPLIIQVSIADGLGGIPIPSCGDLYITIYDAGGESVIQEAFFGECFDSVGDKLPSGASFAASVDSAGLYTVSARMHVGTDVMSATGEFAVG